MNKKTIIPAADVAMVVLTCGDGSKRGISVKASQGSCFDLDKDGKPVNPWPGGR